MEELLEGYSELFSKSIKTKLFVKKLVELKSITMEDEKKISNLEVKGRSRQNTEIYSIVIRKCNLEQVLNALMYSGSADLAEDIYKKYNDDVNKYESIKPSDNFQLEKCDTNFPQDDTDVYTIIVMESSGNESYTETSTSQQNDYNSIHEDNIVELNDGGNELMRIVNRDEENIHFQSRQITDELNISRRSVIQTEEQTEETAVKSFR